LTDVTDEVIKRAYAARELRELGIDASPADIEHWLTFSPRQRERVNEQWLIMQALSALTRT